MDVLPEHFRWLLAVPVYALAYASAVAVFGWMAKRRGVATSGIWLLMQAGLLGGVIGANAAQLLITGTPGKTIEGGIVGGYLAVVWMKRRLGIARSTGDLFALAIPAGEAIGRIGCFIGGCCFGKTAAVAWSIHDHGALRHPTQLYLALAAALSFALLLWIERKRTLPENGLFYTQLALFCMARFVVEFFREGNVTALGLTIAQLAAVGGFIFAAYRLAAMVGGLKRHYRRACPSMLRP
ncbi:MAG: prolipoprotein diacylglyceryl transferase, partial [Candidatus Eremiobacteraeota bacterium]|nr:prolipoprotein diacylglyceryl transferase [Candidatus Eremiobacteraeota bacterium]